MFDSYKTHIQSIHSHSLLSISFSSLRLFTFWLPRSLSPWKPEYFSIPPELGVSLANPCARGRDRVTHAFCNRIVPADCPYRWIKVSERNRDKDRNANKFIAPGLHGRYRYAINMYEYLCAIFGFRDNAEFSYLSIRMLILSKPGKL